MLRRVALIVLGCLCNDLAAERIVNGSIAAEGEIAWQVGILLFDQLTCGGSIVNENWIVTAAHCSDFPADAYTVVSGSVQLSSGGTMHTVVNIMQHEAWNAVTFENDIAVWQVTPPFVWGTATAPIALLEQGTETPDFTLLTVSGWGAVSTGGSESSDLLRVDVPVVPVPDCDTAYQAYGGVFPSQICAGFADGGADACTGDSGGPLFREGVLHGISSWGNGCAQPGFPGIYTKASAFTDWIRLNTN
ncbi:Hypothetical predicted protein [Cloeon dipterum]|uniref:Peptidase S1 domain-containing protein n=1 Tax=Cloeon dipterum TaxID=197152 RepID=A0A8S1DPF2_9INSE|nr:Hypothetical predicted protein [Cloeon dipterum]